LLPRFKVFTGVLQNQCPNISAKKNNFQNHLLQFFVIIIFFSNTISKKNAFSAVSLLNQNEILLPDLIGFCRGFAHTTQDNTISLFLSFSNV
jgi:hypothetical protein